MLERVIELDRQALTGRLAAVVIHALNNVFGSVVGHMDILAMKGVEGSLGEAFKPIFADIDSGSILARNFMTVKSGLESSRPLNPAECLDATVNVVAKIFKKERIEITRSIPPDLPEISDGGRFTHAVMHALLMALKSTLKSDIAARRLKIEASRREMLELRVLNESLAGSMPFLPNPIPAVPPPPGDDVYPLWVIDRLCPKTGGWSLSDDGRTILLRWSLTQS